MANTATLSYSVTAVGPTLPTALEAALAAVPLDITSMPLITGATFVSDTTTLVGSVATRVLVFDINTPAYIANFPLTGAQEPPWVKLYSQTIALALDSVVVTAPVVIA